MTKITRDAFEWALFHGKIGTFRRSDLHSFDYDEPKMRAALVSAGSWKWSIVHRVALDHSATRRFRAMHEHGMLLLGDPPWRRSRAVVCFGRLGYLEKCVEAMQVVEPVEPYVFAVDRDGRAQCRPDDVECLVQSGLPLPEPGERQRLEVMSDRVRWRLAYSRFAEDEAVRRELEDKRARERAQAQEEGVTWRTRFGRM